MADAEQVNSDQESFVQHHDEPSVDSESDRAPKFDVPATTMTVSHATSGLVDFALDEAHDVSTEQGVCSIKIIPLNSAWSTPPGSTGRDNRRVRLNRSLSCASMSTSQISPVLDFSDVSSFDDLDLIENICNLNTDYDDCIVEDMNNAFNDQL